MSPRFGEALRVRTFEARKQKLLGKAGVDRIRVDLVSDGSEGRVFVYCVSTVSVDGLGEIDSLFVEEHLHGQGVGTELMRRALAWLTSMGAKSKIVSVMSENAEALAFYQRFSFHPRTILLQESNDDAG